MIRTIFSIFSFLLILVPFVVSAAGEMPVGTSPVDGISGAIFEKHGGFLHGFLSVGESYADNILYTSGDELEDFVTRVSPGIWFSIPGGQEEIPATATASSAPGGVVRSSLSSPSFRRLLAYLTYTPEFEFHREYSDENTDSHRAEASIEYRFRGDLSIGVLDRFEASHDDRRTDNSLLTNTYTNNLFRAFATYDVSSDISLDVTYSQFMVDYTRDRNLFRDRQDTSIGATLSYHTTAKTAVFAEYGWTDIAYDHTTLNDSREQNFLGGIRWEITEKSAGVIKAGWGTREWDGSRGDEGTFRMEAQVEHRFTDTTRITIGAYQRTEETNITAADYLNSRGVSLRYAQKISSKLQASLGGAWQFRSYEGAVNSDEEDTYFFNAGISYAFRKWLTSGIEYTFSRQESDFGLYDYTANEVVFRVTVSL